MPDLDPEDAKLVTLARAARARARPGPGPGPTAGAAVRDNTGRTYAAVDVALASLTLGAVQLAVAMAVASGADALEAAALVSDAAEPSPADLAVLRDVTPGTPLYLADPDGTVRGSVPA